MSELQQIISIERRKYPQNESLWVDFYTDINMGASDQLNLNDPTDTSNAYVVLVNVVADWNFAGIDGKKLEISTEDIRKLPARIAEWMLKEATSLIESDKDKKKD